MLARYRGKRWKGVNVDLVKNPGSMDIDIFNTPVGSVKDVSGMNITDPEPTDTMNAIYDGLIRFTCFVNLNDGDGRGGHRLHTIVKLTAVNSYGDCPESIESVVDYDMRAVYYDQLVPEIDLGSCQIITHDLYGDILDNIAGDTDQLPANRYEYLVDHGAYYDTGRTGNLLRNFEKLWFTDPDFTDNQWTVSTTGVKAKVKMVIRCKKVPWDTDSFKVSVTRSNFLTATAVAVEAVTEISVPGPQDNFRDFRNGHLTTTARLVPVLIRTSLPPRSSSRPYRLRAQCRTYI